MLAITDNNLMVARLPDGRTLSFYQREAPVPRQTAEEGFMPGQLTHMQLLQFMMSVATEQRGTRYTAGVCMPDVSIAGALGVPVDLVRSLLADLAENGKVHRTSLSRDGVGNWCLGRGM